MPARMTRCATCGAEVATSASTCPGCGARRTRVGNAVALAGLIAILAVIAYVVVVIAGHHG